MSSATRILSRSEKMPTGQINISASVGGIPFSCSISRTVEGIRSDQGTMDSGKSSVLTTRTDDDTGDFTMVAGHGLLLNDRVDLFWAGGCAYNRKVTVVVADLLTIDSVAAEGGGDNLPEQGSTVIVGKRKEVKEAFDGDDTFIVLVSSEKRGHIDFMKSATETLKPAELKAGEPFWWYKDCGHTNPLAGDPIVNAYISCGELESSPFKFVALVDSM